MPSGTTVYIRLNGYSSLQARVIWASESAESYGCKFDVPMAQAVVDHIVGGCTERIFITRAA